MKPHRLLSLLFAASCLVLWSDAQEIEILGTGTESLIGGDLTDPEDDGDPDFDDGYDAIFDTNSEPGFGDGDEPEGAGNGEADQGRISVGGLSVEAVVLLRNY